jgi:sarcosine oxidase subunit alpha
MTTMRTGQHGRIDRTRPIAFTFDGRRLSGLAGDTLASALLAHGIHLVGRSFKYHRPRGILAAGSEEPNALVRVGNGAARATPNLRATQVEIYDGLVAESQNRTPSLGFDLGAINDILAPLFPAGFYYKTFMWPGWAWKRLYEPVIRRAAGLGRAPTEADPDHYAQRYAHCDVLVIGAGPAGLAAAQAAAQRGARVILCDEQAELGGSLLDYGGATAEAAWRTASLAALASHPRVTLLARTTAFGVFADNFYALTERITDHQASPDPARPRERLWQVRARQLVLAAGAIERPMVFAGNDRPGIMLAGAARSYLRRYGVRAGTRCVLITNNDDAYEVADDLAQAGIEIVAIADTRPAAGRRAPNQHLSTTIMATGGRLRVNSATLRHASGSTRKVACDLLLMSGGKTPSVHLFSQGAGTLRFDAGLGAFIPAGDTALMQTAGACRGVMDFADAVQDGTQAGAAACHRAQLPMADEILRGITPASRPHLPDTPPITHGRAFVDFQNDVTTKDIALALREGFTSVEHVKRYTTTGMATDQGKTSNINALALQAQSRGLAVPEIGLTTYRMPYTPVTFGALAGVARGTLFDPVRTTPIHGWAASRNAVFEDVALWKRARYFPAPGETMHQAVARECLAVRHAAGIFDASTLGKIDVSGPDAAVFLERLYINGFRKLSPGRARYGVLLREDGFILDDGVIGRVSPENFHVTTTTGGAPRVLAMMEDYLQTEFSDLKLWLTSTTEQWAVIAIQGPRSREILAPLVDGIDISAAAFPHMSLREGKIRNARLRLFRVSFTGELGFELNVPADDAQMVWDAVMAQGRAFGLTPYGTETMHVLRAEKGYIIVGQDTDGTATPDDAGLAWAINTQKPDFVGKRSLARAAMQAAQRKQLVGLLAHSADIVLEEGAQLVADSAAQSPRRSLGHVTSAYHSATLGHGVALAMLEGGRARHGQTLRVPMPGGDIKVRVTEPVFYDPKGERLNA